MRSARFPQTNIFASLDIWKHFFRILKDGQIEGAAVTQLNHGLYNRQRENGKCT